jgi:uncharacterized protein (TIGR02001 family)
MRFTKLSPIALATTLALGGLAAIPVTANAELGYNASVASMYLWRGQDVSNGPAVSGGIDYSHESGLYVSTWVSSGVAASSGSNGGGYEYDIWAGYAGEVSGLGYDISYWAIEYPQETNALDVINETALGLTYSMFSLGYIDGDGYSYTTLGASYDAFSVKYGIASNDTAGDYTHLDLSYAATDALSFTVSYNINNDDGVLTAPKSLFMVAYSLPIDIK